MQGVGLSISGCGVHICASRGVSTYVWSLWCINVLKHVLQKTTTSNDVIRGHSVQTLQRNSVWPASCAAFQQSSVHTTVDEADSQWSSVTGNAAERLRR